MKEKSEDSKNRQAVACVQTVLSTWESPSSRCCCWAHLLWNHWHLQSIFIVIPSVALVWDEAWWLRVKMIAILSAPNVISIAWSAQLCWFYCVELLSLYKYFILKTIKKKNFLESSPIYVDYNFSSSSIGKWDEWMAVKKIPAWSHESSSSPTCLSCVHYFKSTFGFARKDVQLSSVCCVCNASGNIKWT